MLLRPSLKSRPSEQHMLNSRSSSGSRRVTYIVDTQACRLLADWDCWCLSKELTRQATIAGCTVWMQDGRGPLGPV